MAEVHVRIPLVVLAIASFVSISCGSAQEQTAPAEAAPVAAAEPEAVAAEEGASDVGETPEVLLQPAPETEISLAERETMELMAEMQAQEGAREPLPDVASAPQERTYTVRPGDTLGSIAAAEYGDPSRYREIFDANRDQLESADSIQPGTVIVLP